MYRSPFCANLQLQSRWITSIFTRLSSVRCLVTQLHGLDVQQRRIRSSNTVLVSQFQSNRLDRIFMAELNTLCQGDNPRRSVYRALHESKWTFERTLTGKPSDGTAHGHAQFHHFNSEGLLYKEQGKLFLSSSNSLDITQKYLYIYNSSEDLLSVYFVDEHNQRTSLFHTIQFQPKDTSSLNWIAHGEHLCGQDHYSTSYLFVFNGINLSRLEIIYTVKGPAKDYISKTIFHREKLDEIVC